MYRLNIEFGEDYPEKPPICRFKPVLFHPNVYPSGRVCLSLLDPDKGWKPTITVKQVPDVPPSKLLRLLLAPTGYGELIGTVDSNGDRVTFFLSLVFLSWQDGIRDSPLCVLTRP